MTKKYNGYFLCILLMLLISIACMLVVFNVQVEAEGEIQYNLTLYYSEEDVGTSYLFADGTQISLPNDLSDYDENYKYTFYSYDSETKTKGEILSSLTITMNDNISLFVEKVKKLNYIIYNYTLDGVKDNDFNSYSCYGQYSIEQKDNYKIRYYNSETKEIGDEIAYDTIFYEDKTFVQIPAFNVIAYDYNDEIISTTYIDWHEEYIFPAKSSIEGKKSLGWSYNKNSNRLINSIVKDSFDDITIYEYVEKTFEFNIQVNETVYADKDTLQSQLIDLPTTYYELCNFLLSLQNSNCSYTLFVLKDGENIVFNGYDSNYRIDETKGSPIQLTLDEVYETYTITYNLNGGSFTQEQNVLYEYNYASGFALRSPSRLGYTFINWTITGTDTPIDLIFDREGDLEIDANWEANKYTISFVIDSSLGVYEDYEATYDERLIGINDDRLPTKYGYSFIGWSYVENERSGIVDSNTIYQFARNISLYPVFENLKFNISFDSGFEECKVDPIEVEYDKPINISDLTYKGYTFKGWIYEDRIFKNEDIYTYINNITLTAVWEANKYNINLYVAEDKEPQIIEVTYDSSVNLISSYVLENTKNLIGFYLDEIQKDNLIAKRDGIIEKWTLDKDVNIYVYCLDKEDYISNAQISISNLPDDYTLLLDNKAIESDTKIDEIGVHTIIVKQNNNSVYVYNITIKEDYTIDTSIVYDAPPVINKINATVLLDGKEIEFKDGKYRLDKNGTHTITVLGAGDYKQEYTYTYENKNIFYSWFFLGIGILVMVITIVFAAIGRRHMIQDDTD